jgi:hypothetical protein
MSLLGRVLGSVERDLSNAGGFAKGVGEGAWNGVKGTVSGVGHLAEDGYKLATDSHYREQAWNSAINDARAAANFTAAAVTDPGEAADEIGKTASDAWHVLETAHNQAAARGEGSEFIGQIFGQGVILVGATMVPGGAAADAAEAIGEGGRAAELLGEAGKLTDAAGSAKLSKDAGQVAADSAAKPIARGEPYAFGTGTRSERATALIKHAATALGRKHASSLVDTVVYDPAERAPSFWVDPNTGERIITINPATFGKTKAGQLIAGAHELIHAEAWERALNENAGDLAATHRQIFIPEFTLIYATREIETERRAVQSVARLLGRLTPQQVGHSTRYFEKWQAFVTRLTGSRVP